MPSLQMIALVLNVLAVIGLPTLSGADIGLRFLSVLLLIAINAFFVTAEFSIVSVRRSRIYQLVEAGDVQAIAVQSLQRSIDRVLSTTQLGITLSSLALGWVGESTMGILVTSWIERFPLPVGIRSLIAHSLSIPLAFLLVAYLQIVLGELCPKSVALLYSEQLARFLGPPLKAIARFFNPFIWILNQSTRWLLRLVGIQYTGQGWKPPVTSEELQLIISTERESTGLEAEERELLNNIFEFGDVKVAEVMVQRPEIVSLPVSATLQTLLQEIAATGHSRYPVIGKSLDDVRGIIHFKDLAEPMALGKLCLKTEIYPWIRRAKFIPENASLSELLPAMQQSLRQAMPSEQAMVIVVNEFGGTVGLVTLQNLIAEIIGNAGAAENNEELLIQNLDEQTFLVQAQMNLEDLNELLDLTLPLTNEYQTLGGFVLYQLQEIPAVGTTLHYQDLELTVVSVEGPRLHQIQLRRLARNRQDGEAGEAGREL
jgi:CBS domain containing-hemolysin-like protein